MDEVDHTVNEIVKIRAVQILQLKINELLI